MKMYKKVIDSVFKVLLVIKDEITNLQDLVNLIN